MDIEKSIINCPVEVAMGVLGKKWTIHILRDMFRGITKFSDFLKLNPKLSTRVLSLRLKELAEEDMIERIVLAETPIHIEYHLKDRGIALNEVIVALSKFSITEFPERVFATVERVESEVTLAALAEAEQRFTVISSVSDYGEI